MRNQVYQQPRQQKGMVMLMMLLIFALAAVISTELFYSSHRDIRRTSNMMSQNEAYLFALGGEAFAIQKLLKDFEEDKVKPMMADDLTELWSVSSAPFDLDEDEEETKQNIGEIEIIIEDLQARFNINNINRFAEACVLSKT